MCREEGTDAEPHGTSAHFSGPGPYTAASARVNLPEEKRRAGVRFFRFRRDPAGGFGGARSDGGDLLLGQRQPLLPARTRAFAARHALDRHLSPRVFTARSAAEEGSLGRFANRHERAGIESAGERLGNSHPRRTGTGLDASFGFRSPSTVVSSPSVC